MDRRLLLVFRGVIVLLTVLAALSSLSSCMNPLQFRNPLFSSASDDLEPVVPPQATRILVVDPEFTLAWDYDQESTGAYSVYYREYETLQWSILVEGLMVPSLNIDSSILEYGEYEFAVSFTPENGEESELHTSLDATALPDTGWYLVWEVSV